MKIDGIKITAPVSVSGSTHGEIITPDALRFIAKLHTEFEKRRQELLAKREVIQQEISHGKLPDFLSTTADIREADWTVAPIKSDLERRWVEITGPVDRKMIINALNSGADVFMADFEDSNSPTWQNNMDGQINLKDAVNGTIAYDTPQGKHYELADKTATLMVRPRGWHLNEEHVLVNGKPISASLFDFGLYLYHNAEKLLQKGSGPYFYLPKVENHEEAKLWDDVFRFAQDELNLGTGAIRATVLIETILAAFEMDEILYSLKDHSAGLNAGRWDYLFSAIKKFRDNPAFIFPDRSELTMDKPPLDPYADLLVQTTHRRGIHAMGGMAAQVPIKNDKAVNDNALENIRNDKLREAQKGFDGAWVAHPGLVPVVREIFEQHLKGKSHQIENPGPSTKITSKELLTIPSGKITEAGLRTNVRATILYLAPWLNGTGCVAIDHKMEDAATVEISRSQLWQWLEHKAKLEDGRTIFIDLVDEIRHEELEKIKNAMTPEEFKQGKYELASELLNQVVTNRQFSGFITQEAYPYIQTHTKNDQEVFRIEPKEQFVKRVQNDWKTSPRWQGIIRPYTAEKLYKVSGPVAQKVSIAKMGAKKLWEAIHSDEGLRVLSALTGNQAIQEVAGGLGGIYLSGWQVAADANDSLEMYPDQSLYAAHSVPILLKRLNNALLQAGRIDHSEGNSNIDWMVPIVADGESGFGGPLNSFELMKCMIRGGAAGVHFEDQLASAKKCGHMGGKVLVPTREFIQKLAAARLASDVMGVDTILIARTDAERGALLTSDIDENDKPFVDYSKGRTSEGFYYTKAGLDQAISRGLAYAPYADMIWCETAKPDLKDAQKFADAIHAKYPGKLLAYNCSPSFNWKANLDDKTIAIFQDELNKMGYKFQFITLSGFHVINLATFLLAHEYREKGMPAYVKLQQAEFEAEKDGYRAAKHQAFVGTGYFDEVAKTVSGGSSSTLSLQGSTEEAQFKH